MPALRAALVLFAAHAALASDYYFFDADALGIEWIDLPGGEFTMGSADDDIARYCSVSRDGTQNDPLHTVWVDAFSMAKTEITNAQYLIFLNEAWNVGMLEVEYYTNTSSNEEPGWSVISTAGPYEGKVLCLFDAISTSEEHVNRGYFEFNTTMADLGLDDPFYIIDDTKTQWPAVFMHWYGAAAFAYHFNLSLPSEAQWEYAARADFDYEDEELLYATDNGLLEETNCNLASTDIGHPQPVCSFTKSAWGFCDICGNVWEWTMDWYANNYYACSPYDDPDGPTGTDEFWEDDDFRNEWQGTLLGHSTKCLRGGAYNYHDKTAQITYRKTDYPYHGNDHFGMRMTKYHEYEPYTPDSCEDDDIYLEALAAWNFTASSFDVSGGLVALLFISAVGMVAFSWHRLYRGSRSLDFFRRKDFHSADIMDDGETKSLLMKPTV